LIRVKAAPQPGPREQVLDRLRGKLLLVAEPWSGAMTTTAATA